MKTKITVFIFLFWCSTVCQLFAGGKWYHQYAEGLEFMKKGNWSLAIERFQLARRVMHNDSRKMQTYGMHFIEYFPNREMGICYYNLGDTENARRYLSISVRQDFTARAQEYLLKSGGPMPEPPPTLPPEKTVEKSSPKSDPEITTPIPMTGVKRVGERMGIAVLPFQTQGLGAEIEEINIVEKVMTTFYSLDRFKLYERTQLEKILEEQKLGMTGVLDASTAAEIGKGIGVEAIVLGTVTRAGNNIAIDARLIDTESAEIISAQDELSERTNIQALKNAIQRLASKMVQDLPLVEGLVIAVSGDQLTLDIGSNDGIKKGMKCIIYKEGPDLIHPITKKVLGKQTEELGEIKLNQVYPSYSVGKVVKKNKGFFAIGNKFVTK